MFGTRLSEVPNVGSSHQESNWGSNGTSTNDPRMRCGGERWGRRRRPRRLSVETGLTPNDLFARHMPVWLVSSQSWLPAASWLLRVNPRTHWRHLEPRRFPSPSANYLHNLLPSGNQRSRLRGFKRSRRKDKWRGRKRFAIQRYLYRTL